MTNLDSLLKSILMLTIPFKSFHPQDVLGARNLETDKSARRFYEHVFDFL